MSSQWILFIKISRAHSLLYLVIILLPFANPVNLSNFHGLTELLSASSILFYIIRHDDVTSAPGYLQLGVDRLFARSFSSKRPPLGRVVSSCRFLWYLIQFFSRQSEKTLTHLKKKSSADSFNTRDDDLSFSRDAWQPR